MKPLLACFVLILGVSTIPAFAQKRNAQSHDSSAQTIFNFHSSFWVNLHHFLYLEALSENPQFSRRPAALSADDLAALHALTPAERAAWDEAVTYYAHSMIQHDLLFDHDLISIQIELEDEEASTDLAAAQIPAEVRAILLKAAPIYRAHWWPAHDQKNRAAIAQLEPLVAKYGDSLKTSLAKIYETPWPDEPIRVDMMIYANWAGAYTTLFPTRVSISTSEPANPEAGALETVFHESSHGMVDKVQAAIDHAAAAQKPPYQPGAIWHAVLFYTTGVLVARQLPGYVPMADRIGLWKRAWPDPDRALIAQDWQPHIDGKIGLEPALAKLVSDLAAQPGK
jgi:hypothetical protein